MTQLVLFIIDQQSGYVTDTDCHALMLVTYIIFKLSSLLQIQKSEVPDGHGLYGMYFNAVCLLVLSSSATSEWIQFFKDAGIPPGMAVNYAVSFVDNR